MFFNWTEVQRGKEKKKERKGKQNKKKITLHTACCVCLGRPSYSLQRRAWCVFSGLHLATTTQENSGHRKPSTCISLGTEERDQKAQLHPRGFGFAGSGSRFSAKRAPKTRPQASSLEGLPAPQPSTTNYVTTSYDSLEKY